MESSTLYCYFDRYIENSSSEIVPFKFKITLVDNVFSAKIALKCLVNASLKCPFLVWTT